MTEDQVTDETTEEQAVEEAQEAQSPAKKLTVPQRLDRLEELLIKQGVADAGSLGR